MNVVDVNEVYLRLKARNITGEEVSNIVRKILMDVKNDGDKALRTYTLKFDKVDYFDVPVRVSQEEIESAENKVSLHMKKV
ncbi:MAG TPA: hypothetical protein DDZ89_04545, partial [Clostridiales bacterium]|nr:hypothetical protein [Clostridiales bacterium]